MNSVYGTPKLRSLEQYSLMPVAQKSGPATQSSVPSQESAAVSAVDNTIQIVYLYILKESKWCALTERF